MSDMDNLSDAGADEYMYEDDGDYQYDDGEYDDYKYQNTNDHQQEHMPGESKDSCSAAAMTVVWHSHSSMDFQSAVVTRPGVKNVLSLGSIVVPDGSYIIKGTHYNIISMFPRTIVNMNIIL